MKKRLSARIITLVLCAIMIINMATSAELVPASAITYADTSGYESLAELYKDYFKVGGACEAISHWGDSKKEIGNPNKEALLLGVFNSITCGNEMKPAYNFDPTKEGLFKIDKAAAEMLTWAKTNGMKMRGHTLCWHSQVNPSIFAKDFVALSKGKKTTSDTAELDEDCLVDRDTLLERLRTYIYSMMEYIYSNGFGDVIYAWDVLNEATDEGKPGGLRQSYWNRIIGPDFIYYVFLYAREAETKFAKQYADLYGLDPNGDLSPIMGKLFYNDYNEWFAARANIIVRFLTKDVYNEGQKMVKSDVIKPDGDGTIYGDGLIDGIGMQGHLTDTQNIDTYIEALMKYSEAVDEVHITELDVGVSKTDDNKWLYQAKFFYRFFTALMDAVDKGAKLTSVTLWGLTDDSSWRSDSYPLLFKKDLTAKPAFEAMVLAAKREEFNMKLSDTVQQLSALKVDFEPYKVDGSTKTVVPSNVGITSRGAGHQSAITLVSKINHTPDAPIGFSLKCARNEQDATVRINVSRFIGTKIKASMYVKSEDASIVFGVDEDDTIKTLISLDSKRVKDDDGWTLVEYVLELDRSLNAAALFFETDGSADIMIDDITIDVTEDAVGITAEGLKALSSDQTDEVVADTETDGSENIIDSAQENTSSLVQENTSNFEKGIDENDFESDNKNSSKTINIILIVAAVMIVLGMGCFAFVKKSRKKR